MSESRNFDLIVVIKKRSGDHQNIWSHTMGTITFDCNNVLSFYLPRLGPKCLCSEGGASGQATNIETRPQGTTNIHLYKLSWQEYSEKGKFCKIDNK